MRGIRVALQGLLGFLMNIASLLSIKVTSPITHMVSSAVRGVAASLLGMWLFHDVITTYVPSPPSYSHSFI
jgi:GDP-fucose transporter C1